MKSPVIMLIIVIVFFTIRTIAIAGNWTYYMDGNDIKALVVKGDFIYCASNGGLIIWNRHDKTYEQAMYFAETACCQYQRTMFIAIAVDQNGVVWCTHNEGNNVELLAYEDGGWTVYTPENSGLPGRPQALYVDSDNVLWMSTGDVMASFDGTSWTTYHADGTGHTIKIMLGVDNNNVKWFSTTGGLSSYNGSKWTYFTEDDGLPAGTITAMALGSDNVKWFTMKSKIIMSFDDETWVTHEGLEELPSSIIVDTNNTVWCGTWHGIYKYDGNSWMKYTTENGYLPSDKVTVIAIDDDEVLWIGTYPNSQSMGNGLTRFDGLTWTTLFIEGPLSYLCFDVAVDKNNVKWFSTYNSGVTSFDGSTWKTYTDEYGMVFDGISRITVDNDNMKWFLTYGGKGLLSFDGTNWEVFTSENISIIEDDLLAIAVDHDNVKWIGTASGIISFDGTTWYTYTIGEEFSGNPVGSVSVDYDNVKWFGTMKSIPTNYGSRNQACISSFDGTSWTHYEIEGLKKSPIREIVVDNDNIKWFSERNYGVFSFDGKNWKHYPYPENVINLPEGNGLSLNGELTVDNNGIKWFVVTEMGEGGFSGAGLTSFDGSEWTYQRDNFWLLYAAGRIAIDHNNVKWIATHSGIVRYDGDSESTDPSNVYELYMRSENFSIHNNYPNPFNALTTITFILPSPGLTSLIIYNIIGQEIRKLVSETMMPGTHSVIWDGKDDRGNPVSSGIYFSRLIMGNRAAAGRMLLMK